MQHYWVVKAKQEDGKWVNWAGVTAETKEEALKKAQEHVGFPIRVVPGSPAQDRKFAKQAAAAGFPPTDGKRIP
jgi:hypothetical protein